MKRYSSPSAGGEWEHRSGDCPKHGANIAFAKPYHSAAKFLCVQCMLACARELASCADVVEASGNTKSLRARGLR